MKDKHDIERPANVGEFKFWLKSNLGYDINDKYQYYYSGN